jgi:large subunit ribosomal protein L35
MCGIGIAGSPMRLPCRTAGGADIDGDSAVYWLKPQEGRVIPVSRACGGVFPLRWKNEKKMPKLKTHTGAKKRFSKTGTGKIKRHQTKTRHILTSKSPKVKRKLGKTLMVSDGDYKKVARMIPYA